MINNAFQLLEIVGNKAGASNKARNDINEIARRQGYKSISISSHLFSNKVCFKPIQKIYYIFSLRKALRSLKNGCYLLIQIPFLNLANYSHILILKYCIKHNIKLICFIHDINDLRGGNSKDNQPFYALLNYASSVISHNSKMSAYLENKGVAKEKIVNLDVFDYLLNDYSEIGRFKKQIIIGGNLDRNKVKYIRDLNRIDGCEIVLYGPNYTEDCNSNNIIYKGTVNASDLPYRLNEGFGLVWDGDSIESCTGSFGEYLKYNNPHKLSMYIASGLPVVIWDQAAEATFVKVNGIGLTVNSLLDLKEVFNSIDEIQYNEYTSNIKVVQSRIVSGYYANKALNKAFSLANQKV